MIVPMRKYSFLVYHKDRDVFLKGLMDLGVLHIINKGEVDDEYAENLVVEIREAEQVLKRFIKRNLEEKPAIKLDEPMPILSMITELERELEQCIHEVETLHTERKLMLPWGEFSWQSIDKLEDAAGMEMRFFQATESQFSKDWLDAYPLQIIAKRDGFVYFVIFRKDIADEFPLVPVALPKKSLHQIESILADKDARINVINNMLNAYAANYTEALQERIKQAKDELDYHLTTKSTVGLADDRLIVLEGWCPQVKQDELAQYAAFKNLVYVEQDPDPEETPPVLLKNNRFSRLFEPIGEMYALPAYSELDLTVFFAPFFLLFFGFCLGDAGYGVVLLIAATIAKMRIADEYKSYATLVQFFGLSTTVIGFFSGTLFGIEMIQSPAFESVRHLMFDQDQMFRIALLIGFVQIIFGMLVQVYKKVIFTGWLSALSRIGWIIALLSLGDYFYLKAYPSISLITLIIGGAMIIFLGAPEKGWLKSIGLGIADLYNITGVAGDLLSYIRLFALGVSSAILGLVVNEIAFSAQAIPYVGIVFTGLILIIGHTANLMLASLSAFVHPMRLTFVEFYKNVGFLGGGKPYQPFTRKSTSNLNTNPAAARQATNQ
jgi:V/A-type H+-transporting ATPase subunit I